MPPEFDTWKCRYMNTGSKWELLEADIILVKYFGAAGMSAVPGASIYLKDGGHVKMDAASWNWVHALLEELRGFREGAINQMIRSKDGEKVSAEKGEGGKEEQGPCQAAQEAEEKAGAPTAQDGNRGEDPQRAESNI